MIPKNVLFYDGNKPTEYIDLFESSNAVKVIVISKPVKVVVESQCFALEKPGYFRLTVFGYPCDFTQLQLGQVFDTDLLENPTAYDAWFERDLVTAMLALLGTSSSGLPRERLPRKYATACTACSRPSDQWELKRHITETYDGRVSQHNYCERCYDMLVDY
jgi:hypothetical protein